MISRDDLIYFIEVTKVRNFSRAAERIGISQPTLSMAIKRIEESIGASLFIRHKKGVTITKSGSLLLTHAQRLLQYWEMVRSKSFMASHHPEGMVNIGSHPSIALSHFSKFLPELIEKYPKLEIHLKLDLSRHIVDQILELTIDIGIVANPTRHPSLVIQKLFNDEFSFWQSISLPFSQAFTPQTTLICDPDLLQTQSLLSQMRKNGLAYSRLISTRSLEVIADLTAHGCGVGILPATIAQNKKCLKQIPKAPSHSDEICIVYRPESREIAAVREIIMAVKKYMIKNKV